MKSAAETVRMVRVAGILAWLLVGVPIVVQGPGQPDRFAVWLGGFVAFGGLFVWATARLDAPGPAFRAALLAQVGCVIAMTATQCRGWEGTLLVLVAMQLGLTTSRRTGLSWIVLQTAALGWAIQHHWSLRSAVLLSPPYLGFQVLALLVFEVLRREIHARTELARTNAELLSTRALLEESARLAERLRLAREIHDGMGSHLAALSLNLEAMAQDASLPPGPLDTARRLTRRLYDEVESLIDAAGRDGGIDLGQALATLASAIPRPRVHLDAPAPTVKDPERAHVLLRCCQEIVTNTVKHAGAANLWISIRVEDGALELSARDDGTGTERLGPGHGLEGMRRRLEEVGGVLDIDTRPGAGFQLRARMPTGSPS